MNTFIRNIYTSFNVRIYLHFNFKDIILFKNFFFCSRLPRVSAFSTIYNRLGDLIWHCIYLVLGLFIFALIGRHFLTTIGVSICLFTFLNDMNDFSLMKISYAINPYFRVWLFYCHQVEEVRHQLSFFIFLCLYYVHFLNMLCRSIGDIIFTKLHLDIFFFHLFKII